jgi:hypothetical protein
MNKHQLRRLARLEAILAKSEAYEVDKWYEYKFALMSVVAFHAGKLSPRESIATAFARALGMTSFDLNNALRGDNYDGPKFLPLFLEQLNTMISARGGRPITENGSPILERPRQDDHRRDGFEVLHELYQEIPDEIKKSHNLLPYLSDYIEMALSADKDNRGQR